MPQVAGFNSAKIDHYADLLLDQEKLIRSSRNIIRKKHSPLARQIARGNVKAIIRAAKDRIFGSLSKKQRLNLCKILCDLKNKLKNSITERWREFIVAAISTWMADFTNASGGLLIGFLWMIRNKMQDLICSCKLSGACQSGTCA